MTDHIRFWNAMRIKPHSSKANSIGNEDKNQDRRSALVFSCSIFTGLFWASCADDGPNQSQKGNNPYIPSDNQARWYMDPPWLSKENG